MTPEEYLLVIRLVIGTVPAEQHLRVELEQRGQFQLQHAPGLVTLCLRPSQ